MPPKYPWQRQQPTASSSTHPQPPQPGSNNPFYAGPGTGIGGVGMGTPGAAGPSGIHERPIVVSATARNPNSPAAGLSADSPSQLRARVNSPHNRAAAAQGFGNENRAYPSPAALAKKGKTFLSKKKKKGGGGGGEEDDRGMWAPLASDSPGVKRYDPRGYPARDGADGSPARLSPESIKTGYGRSNGKGKLSHSHSQDSLASDVSSTGAGVNEETGRFLSSNHTRPASYYAVEESSSYPPVMDYSLRAPSYAPYKNEQNAHTWSNGHGRSNGSNGYMNGHGYVSGKEPAPSLYAQSAFSMVSQKSDNSLTHFGKTNLNHIQDSYGAFSISSKGGKKHIGDMFSLPADPASWSYLGPEADDDFHDPDIRPNRQTRFVSAMMTMRGASNLGCLIFLFIITVGLFGVYPITYQYLAKLTPTYGAYNLGGINATGQIPNIGPFQLIDRDTPQSAYTHKSFETGTDWELVFSDEFNNDGRTFWDGDDPYWQAVDLHYWQTNNLEWYDPGQVTTKDGKLVITLDNVKTNGLNYRGGMIQTWNRFCFTGGYVEAAVSLPGKSNIYGLWPAIWTLGNLGRAGYGGTLDGLWPYSYDACDVGTLANQTLNGQPQIALTQGDPKNGNSLSYLPGQRLSRCTCAGDTHHPGPVHSDGTFVGRGAPEIDMFEAVVDSTTLRGEVSQSGQWAPFNPRYQFINTSSTYKVYDSSMTYVNPWLGSVWQQATSALSYTDQQCYTKESGCLSIYGFEYAAGDDGYITWVNDNKLAWTVRGSAMAANTAARISQRPVPVEPMYLIMNLGISENFGPVDYAGLAPLFPVTMEVDYIRVYQDPAKRNIGCDPADYPTANYIASHPEIYSNANITVMDQIPNFAKPKNRLISQC